MRFYSLCWQTDSRGCVVGPAFIRTTNSIDNWIISWYHLYLWQTLTCENFEIPPLFTSTGLLLCCCLWQLSLCSLVCVWRQKNTFRTYCVWFGWVRQEKNLKSVCEGVSTALAWWSCDDLQHHYCLKLAAQSPSSVIAMAVGILVQGIQNETTWQSKFSPCGRLTFCTWAGCQISVLGTLFFFTFRSEKRGTRQCFHDLGFPLFVLPYSLYDYLSWRLLACSKCLCVGHVCSHSLILFAFPSKSHVLGHNPRSFRGDCFSSTFTREQQAGDVTSWKEDKSESRNDVEGCLILWCLLLIDSITVIMIDIVGGFECLVVLSHVWHKSVEHQVGLNWRGSSLWWGLW